LGQVTYFVIDVNKHYDLRVTRGDFYIFLFWYTYPRVVWARATDNSIGSKGLSSSQHEPGRFLSIITVAACETSVRT
jgi:hypothetical protein